jgi:RNA polymerase sigma-70 factor (ECF subfamily)
MKKFEIIVTTKQGEKKVSVYVENETAAMLKTCPEEVRLAYLKELYKEQLLERKETRRHVSLEKITANGRDFESLDKSPMETIIEAEESEYVKNLLDKLTDKQREVFVLYVFDGKTFESIAKKMGRSIATIYEIYNAAIKKLKKFL